MAPFQWKKKFLRGSAPLHVVNVVMKEVVTQHYDVSRIKKPCWLVFRHTETGDYCCVGLVQKGQKTLSNTVQKEERSLIRSYSDWNEIMVRYASDEPLSKTERACAEKILDSKEGDKEWQQLRKYWKCLKELN